MKCLISLGIFYFTGEGCIPFPVDDMIEGCQVAHGWVGRIHCMHHDHEVRDVYYADTGASFCKLCPAGSYSGECKCKNASRWKDLSFASV